MTLFAKRLEFLSSLAVARKVELVSVITPDALPILGDRIQLQQVILNLVVNGIDAMKDTPSENRIISIRTSRVEKFAQLSVSDRGPGIPEDKLKEVFEPFFTSKAEGMGMGLSIARTIIEAHHGQISAKNRDHGGASFQDQASSCPIVGDPWCPYEADPTSAIGTFETCRRTVTMSVYRGRAEVVGTWPNRRE